MATPRFKLCRGAANAKVTPGCGPSQCVLQWALCFSKAGITAGPARREGGRGSTLQPVVFTSVLALCSSVPNPKGALMETCHPGSKPGTGFYSQ